MMKKQFIKRDLKAEMEGRWLEYFRSFNNVALDYACDNLDKNVPCPINGGKDGFYLFSDAASTGGGGRWQEAHFKTGFSLVIWLTGWEYKDVARDIESFLGDHSFSTKTVRKETQANQKVTVSDKYKNWVLTSWANAKPITRDTAAWMYLCKRGIHSGATSKALRFSNMSYKDDDGKHRGFYPCILSRVDDNAGNLVQLHRTYITDYGAKMSQFGPAKKLTAAISSNRGRVIRLSPCNGAELSVAEGIETALSVTATTRKPTWALVNVGNFARFEPPSHVKTIHNWIDKDASMAGQTKAVDFKKRMNELGVKVIDHIPLMPIPKGSKGVDWNDQLLSQPSAFFI